MCRSVLEVAVAFVNNCNCAHQVIWIRHLRLRLRRPLILLLLLGCIGGGQARWPVLLLRRLRSLRVLRLLLQPLLLLWLDSRLLAMMRRSMCEWQACAAQSVFQDARMIASGKGHKELNTHAQSAATLS